MDNEKRAADWPIKPGAIIGHSSDGESPFDVAIEVGLSEEASLYIGEVAKETLEEYGVKVPFAGWYVCLRTATELRPVAMTCQGADGDEGEELARFISAAIKGSAWASDALQFNTDQLRGKAVAAARVSVLQWAAEHAPGDLTMDQIRLLTSEIERQINDHTNKMAGLSQTLQYAGRGL